LNVRALCAKLIGYLIGLFVKELIDGEKGASVKSDDTAEV